MVKIDMNTIYIIGGYYADHHFEAPFFGSSDNTWIMNTNTFEVKEGPSLMEKRFSASAAKMNFNGKTFIAIAGGYGGNGRRIILDSVELLDVSSPGQSWIEGKNNQITINFLNTILYTIQIFII